LIMFVSSWLKVKTVGSQYSSEPTVVCEASRKAPTGTA
jgi:hypothetical protein